MSNPPEGTTPKPYDCEMCGGCVISGEDYAALEAKMAEANSSYTAAHSELVRANNDLAHCRDAANKLSAQLEETRTRLVECEKARDQYAQALGSSSHCVIQKVIDELGPQTLISVEKFKALKADNEALRKALTNMPTSHRDECFIKNELGNWVLTTCHKDCFERMRRDVLKSTPTPGQGEGNGG